ncbi:50S ribosomal protein L19 [Patescibacteria group bacterium]|nr:50S ribosomal protein L19 [Patescibacteria group bacterium]
MNQVITPVKTEERTKLGIRPGDTVRVHQKIVEKGKTRLQVFEGLVLAVKHGTEAGASFTVRATLSGIGVERVFPLYAPFIEKIEIVKRSKVRRAKLYFIRDKVAREVRRQLRNMRMMNVSTTDFKEEEKEVVSVLPEENQEEKMETAPEVAEAGGDTSTEAAPEAAEEKAAV